MSASFGKSYSFGKDNPEWTAVIISQGFSEKIRIKRSKRQHRWNEQDARTIVQQRVFSMPPIVLVQTSCKTKKRKD